VTPIKDISSLHPEIKKLEQKQSSKIIQKRDIAKSSKPGSAQSSAPIQDKVSISDVGKNLLSQQSTIDSYVQELENIQILSDEKRAEIKEKIRKGDYDRTDVYQIISNTLINRSGFVKHTSALDSTKDNLEEIARQSQSGYYDSEDVIDTLVDRLLNSGDI